MEDDDDKWWILDNDDNHSSLEENEEKFTVDLVSRELDSIDNDILSSLKFPIDIIQVSSPQLPGKKIKLDGFISEINKLEDFGGSSNSNQNYSSQPDLGYPNATTIKQLTSQIESELLQMKSMFGITGTNEIKLEVDTNHLNPTESDHSTNPVDSPAETTLFSVDTIIQRLASLQTTEYEMRSDMFVDGNVFQATVLKNENESLVISRDTLQADSTNLQYFETLLHQEVIAASDLLQQMKLLHYKLSQRKRNFDIVHNKSSCILDQNLTQATVSNQTKSEEPSIELKFPNSITTVTKDLVSSLNSTMSTLLATFPEQPVRSGIQNLNLNIQTVSSAGNESSNRLKENAEKSSQRVGISDKVANDVESRLKTIDQTLERKSNCGFNGNQLVLGENIPSFSMLTDKNSYKAVKIVLSSSYKNKLPSSFQATSNKQNGSEKVLRSGGIEKPSKQNTEFCKFESVPPVPFVSSAYSEYRSRPPNSHSSFHCDLTDVAGHEAYLFRMRTLKKNFIDAI